MKYGLHWFRRDLRVAGNRALQKQFKLNEGRVLGVFCFDKQFLSRDDFSVNRFQFFLNTLVELKKELRALGSDLLVLDIGPQEAFSKLFQELDQAGIALPNMFSWGRDYEPFAIKRDKNIIQFLKEKSVPHFNERDHLLIEPKDIHKPDGSGYQVYTPFSRKWLELFKTSEIRKRVELEASGIKYLNSERKEKLFKISWEQLFQGKVDIQDHLDRYVDSNAKKVTVEIPEAGSKAGFKKLQDFAEQVSDYGKERDFPSLQATSQLSTFLKNGSLTVPQIIHYLKLKPYVKKQTGKEIYLSELIWREFYYHILFRNREVESQAFIEKYQKIKWENNEQYFSSWKAGVTGFPIVDAGMRELKTTGWMHNRVRMIVASFLTKDLLIDWRWGEKYFMETLLDGDLAANNGGWQWAASTGCDPQPYFRIFNPWLQSKKFDPEGRYIKKYIPELSSVEPKKLHEPIEGHENYPEPIVDHSVQRNKALAMYKQCDE